VVRNGYHKERTVLTDVGPGEGADPVHPQPRQQTGEVRLGAGKAVPSAYSAHGRGAGVHAPDGRLAGVDGGHEGLAFGEKMPESLSALTPDRLKKEWSTEREEWSRGSLGDDQWVYL